LAVHSLKDLPTVLPEGLAVAAIPERETPLDALVGATLDTLAPQARVGTSSLRRAAQLKRLRPDLRIESVRGNLDTRLRKLDEGQFDAIMLAGAGLRRLGWADRISQLLPPDVMCPAVGQGALAIETRSDSGPAAEICARLDHAPTRAAVVAERAVLASLGGGCQVPIGAYAVVNGAHLQLRSVVIDPDGAAIISDQCEGLVEDAQALGSAAAARLLEGGAKAILATVYGQNQPLAGKHILVTRARSQAGTLSAKLRGLGADVIELPVIDFAPLDFQTPDWHSYHWAIFTSVNGVEFIGAATADALRARGLEPDVVPEQYIAESVVEALSAQPLQGARILLPRAAAGRDVIPEELRALGAHVDVLPVYQNVVPPDLAAQARNLFTSLKPDWVTITSSSTVKNLLAAAGPEALAGVRVASIGPVTSEVARRHGLTVTVEADPSTIESLIAAIEEYTRQHAAPANSQPA
jgi:hydroxymethylbilane synthase